MTVRSRKTNSPVADVLEWAVLAVLAATSAADLAVPVAIFAVDLAVPVVRALKDAADFAAGLAKAIEVPVGAVLAVVVPAPVAMAPATKAIRPAALAHDAPVPMAKPKRKPN